MHHRSSFVGGYAQFLFQPIAVHPQVQIFIGRVPVPLSLSKFAFGYIGRTNCAHLNLLLGQHRPLANQVKRNNKVEYLLPQFPEPRGVSVIVVQYCFGTAQGVMGVNIEHEVDVAIDFGQRGEK